VLALLAQRLRDPLHTLAGLFGGSSILVERNLLGRMLEADRGEMPLVCLTPGVSPHVIAAVTQQHRLHLQPYSLAGRTRSFAGARKIPDRFVPFIRNDDASQIAGARLPREQQRIAPIRLDALFAGTACDARRCNNLTLPVLFAQVAHPAIPTRPCFVHQQRVLGSATLTSQRLAQLRGQRIDSANKSRRCTARIRNRDCNGVFVNVQSDIGSDRLFHGLSPALGSLNPHGSLHVVRRL